MAEHEGRIIGSNFPDERGPVRGVGPITVDPQAQQRGAGRRLMAAPMTYMVIGGRHEPRGAWLPSVLY